MIVLNEDNKEVGKARDRRSTSNRSGSSVAVAPRAIRSEVIKYLRNKDLNGLTSYLKDMPHDCVLDDPKDSRTIYHKADNGVKSGWGEHRNGKRQNITLYSDDKLAKILMNEF